ncbi:MAG: hypothetical protein CVU90_10315 [Firmicutes bacterium HGW-Firmicutes-15]|nr:MAG: hypothetical protein CVU90_10315 [Firmicutes bacterium HGW-Firmicutes-15]
MDQQDLLALVVIEDTLDTTVIMDSLVPQDQQDLPVLVAALQDPPDLLDQLGLLVLDLLDLSDLPGLQVLVPEVWLPGVMYIR